MSVPGMSNLTLEWGPSGAVHPVDSNARDPATPHRRVKLSAFILINTPFDKFGITDLSARFRFNLFGKSVSRHAKRHKCEYLQQ